MSIEVLFPDQELTIKGEVITLKPIKFGQIPKIMKIAAGLSDPHALALVGSNDAGTQMKGAMLVLAEVGEEILSFVASCINKDKAYMDDLEMDEGVKLLMAFGTINADFFVKKVWPLIKKTAPSN